MNSPALVASLTTISALIVSAAAFSAVAAAPARVWDQATEQLVFIGTFTGGASKGIYVCRLNATGRLSTPELAAEATNPAFLALHPNRRVLYAANEVDRFGGKAVGAVSAFAINAATGKLTLLNQRSSGGTGPCHVSVDRTGRCLLVANYAGGSIAALPIRADGSLGEAASFIHHTGSSVNPQRQQGPHAHQIVPDAANRFAFVCDLGLDWVLAYRLDPDWATLAPNDPPFTTLKPGSGPRHLAFHPNGRFAYVLNEMGSAITAFAYDAPRGTLAALQTLSTLPGDFEGASTAAELAAHPSGKFLYASNRGDDSIAAYSIDTNTGKLTFLQRRPTQGKTPRFIGLDPVGGFLFACNQDSGNIVVFRIDGATGRLELTGQRTEVPSPVCLVFLESSPLQN